MCAFILCLCCSVCRIKKLKKRPRSKGCGAIEREREVYTCVKLVKYNELTTHGGVRGIASAFLTSALDGGECSATRPGRFTPGEGTPGKHWLRGWVSPRAGLDAVK
jgi:hypothetical protein